MKNKFKKPVIRLILSIVTMYCVSEFASCISNQDEEIYRNHPVISSNIIPDYYNDLFKPELKNKIKLMISYEKKGKDTVSNFLYDGKYYIQVYKLSNVYDLSLKNSLKESYNRNELEVGVIFYDNQRSFINIRDRMVISKSDIPSKIFISLYGENPIIVIKNDSLADYYLNFKNLSIKYAPDGPQEVYAEVNKHASQETLPVEILLVKKDEKLYFILMSPEKGVKLNSKTLYNLIDR